MPSYREDNKKHCYKFYNANPKKKLTVGDCVIRAITKASGEEYIKVYDSLCEIGRGLCCPPNWKDAFEEYLKNNGFVKMKQPKKPNGKKYTVTELAKEIKKGRIVVSIARHLTCIVDGTIYDTWDCSQKCVGNYWIKK